MSYREASMDSKCKESYRKMSKKRMSPRKMSKKRMSPKKKGSARRKMNSYEDYAGTKTPEELGEDLINAAEEKDNNIPEMSARIQQGADVNYEINGKTPAVAAAKVGHINNLRFLLDNRGILIGANLEGANLEGANLEGADLRGADLRGANLTRADLTRADLRGANLNSGILTGAILEGANLTGVDFRGADLTGANLTGAILEGSNLTGANLTGANLTGANLEGTTLTEAKIPNEYEDMIRDSGAYKMDEVEFV